MKVLSILELLGSGHLLIQQIVIVYYYVLDTMTPALMHFTILQMVKQSPRLVQELAKSRTGSQ
jgi:hypothetical protein